MIKNRVAEFRKQQQKTQEELAKESKISRIALSSIENGTIPNGETMINIAKALGRLVEEIFYEEDVKHE